jgi:hypothetical protein
MSPTIVYVSSSRQWLELVKDAKIAIFLLLPYEISPQIYWTQPILDQRPLATIYIRGIAFGGLLDTGADQSVIPQLLWPKHWGTKRGTTVQGVGGPQLAKVSAQVLQWEDEEGNSGSFQFFIITGLQLCLWRSDIMQQLLMTLTTHKAQPCKEALSQAQQNRTVTRPLGEALSQAQQDKTIIRPWEEGGGPFPMFFLLLWPWLFL